MSVETLTQDAEEFVLLPHAPDWSDRPRYSRRWKQQTESSLLGAEERQSLMDLGLVSLSWKLDPYDAEERCLLVARLIAAKKSGLAVAPYWGRGGKLSAITSPGGFVLESTLWPWQPGDPVFIRSLDRATWTEWEIGEVDAFNAGTFTLTLVDPLSRTYPAKTFCWPLLFGLFTCEELSELTAHHGAVTVKLTQRRPWPRRSLVPVEPPVAAFTGTPLTGPHPFEVTFVNTSTNATSWLWNFGDGETSTDENPVHSYAEDGTYTVTLTATGPGGGDTLTRTDYIVVANPYDDFESYTDGAPLDGMNGGVAWPGPYVSRSNYAGAAAYDDNESYTNLVALNGLNGGTGFGGPFVDRPLYFDPADEATSWADHAVVNNGGTVSAGTKAAAATFIAAIKAAGIRSKILRLNLYAGDQLAACLTPIIKDAGYAFFDLNTGFVSGDYSEATGLTGNTSSTKWIDPGVIPSTDLLLNNLHFGYYNRSASNESGHPCGCHNSAGTNIMRLLCSYGGTTYFSAGAADITVADSLGVGLYLGVQDASERRVYKAGTSINSSASIGGAMPPHSLYFHALNQFGTAANSSARTLAGYTVGRALTGAEVTAFKNAWQAFQTSLSRQV